MKTDKILIKSLLTLFLIFNLLPGYSQLYKINLSETRKDTIKITFLENFNYDVALVYANGVEVFNGILFSKRETGTTYNSFDVFFQVEEIEISVTVFERNHRFSLDYNPLWYKWDINNDPAFYYDPVSCTRIIKPNEDGRFIYISLEHERGKQERRKKPIITASIKPLILD